MRERGRERKGRWDTGPPFRKFLHPPLVANQLCYVYSDVKLEKNFNIRKPSSHVYMLVWVGLDGIMIWHFWQRSGSKLRYLWQQAPKISWQPWLGLPDVQYFTGAPVFQPHPSPPKTNKANQETKSPALHLGPVVCSQRSSIECWRWKRFLSNEH